MVASELMIGNWISFSGKNVKVKDIISSVGFIETDYSPFGYLEVSRIKPICITIELLLNCGFTNYSSEFKPNGFILNGWYVSNIFEFMVLGSSVVLSRIIYLHQLQNLYFALTGKELEIEL